MVCLLFDRLFILILYFDCSFILSFCLSVINWMSAFHVCVCLFVCSVCPLFVHSVIAGHLFTLSLVSVVFCLFSLSSVHSVCLSTIHLFVLSVYVFVCLYICCSVCCLVILFAFVLSLCLCLFALSDWLLNVSSLWLSIICLFVLSICLLFVLTVCLCCLLCLIVFCCLFILFDLSVLSFFLFVWSVFLSSYFFDVSVCPS